MILSPINQNMEWVYKVHKILIVEDEIFMCELLSIHLRDNYELTIANNGSAALNILKEQPFDLIILDVMLPFLDGWDVCKEIRQSSQVPILMLTARTDIEDRVKGLQLGADDYLIKPFDFEELKARVAALLRRSGAEFLPKKDNGKLIFNEQKLVIDKVNRSLQFRGKQLELTSKEYALLLLFAESPNRIFTREEVLVLLWDFTDERDARAIDSHVKNIRVKFRNVAEGATVIKTIWGVGYKFQLSGGINEE